MGHPRGDGRAGQHARRRWRASPMSPGSAASPSRPTPQQAREGLFTTAADQTDPRLHVVPVPLPAPTSTTPTTGRSATRCCGCCSTTSSAPGGFDRPRRAPARRLGERLPGGQRAAGRRPSRRACPAADAFLVQDYHLYPLPALLRDARSRTHAILHFTHIPFPDPPLLRLLPARLARDDPARPAGRGRRRPADAERDVRSFLACCAEFLGVTVDDGERPLVRRTTAAGRACAPIRRASIPRALQRTHALAGRGRGPPSGWRRDIGELNDHPRRPARPEQEPARRLPGVRAPAGDAAGPARAGALPGVPGAVAHRPGRLPRVSRRRLRHDRRDQRALPPTRAASRRSRSSTPTTASRRWRRWSAATCCWSTRCRTG